MEVPTTSQQQMCFRAAIAPLDYLVRCESRARKFQGMEDFSESACFHRLMDMFWRIDNPGFSRYLTNPEREALAEFDRVYQSLPWRVIETHPHISELPGDDLSPLLPSGGRLLDLLELRAEVPPPFVPLSHFFFSLWSRRRAGARQTSPTE